jgi:integrase/recombinase XerD
MFTRRRFTASSSRSSPYAGFLFRSAAQAHLLRHTVATRLLAFGHESIVTTRLYAETTAATLQRRFDALTDPAAHTLISGIRQRQGDEAALVAAELLAQRRAEQVSTAGA